MSSSQVPPISKAPAERTLLIAVTVLIVVAAVQVVAVGIALAPRIDFDKLGRSLAPRPAPPVAEAPPPAAAVAVAPVAPVDDNASQVNALLDEAKKFRDAGNFQGSLEARIEANRLVPNKPGVLLQIASDYASLGKDTEAINVLRKIVALPPGADPADAESITKARAGLAEMTGTGTGPDTGAAAEPAAEPAAPPASGDASVRDEVGIQAGSVMGIVDAKLLDGDPGQKKLRVSIKAASGQTIDPSKVEANVDFYEQDDHEQIVHNDAPHPAEWLSNPVDWANGDPEIFQLGYRMPLVNRGDLPPLQYYGYVIAIYYNGELQDQRADPPSLLNQYAPALHKDLPAATE